MTLYFFYRTALFYVLEHAYLFWRLRPLWKDRPRLRIVCPLWFFCMGLFPLIFLWLPADGTAQRVFARVGGPWQSFAYFCLMAMLFLDVLRVGAWLWRRLFPGRASRTEAEAGSAAEAAAEAGSAAEAAAEAGRTAEAGSAAETARQPGHLSFLTAGLPSGLRRLALVLIVLGAAFYAYGLYEARDIRLIRLEIATAKLPAGRDSLRLAFAADLHVSPRLGGDSLTRVVDMILAQKPDCILLGGDILDDALQGTPADFQELGRLRAPLGTFAVLGNHEAFGDAAIPAERLRRAGLTLLAGQEATAGPLTVIGLDDPQVSAQKGRFTNALTPLLRRADPGRFTIVLDHRPLLRPKSVGRFDLQLSGHTHGGQVFVLAPLMQAQYGVPVGLSSHRSGAGQSRLFVTTGVGFSKLPIRLFVPPEVVIIDLVRKKQGAPAGADYF